MRVKQISLVFLLALLLLSSCKDKLFDFNIQGIESDAEWGIPLYNQSIDAKLFLGNLDSTQAVQTTGDGLLKFVIDKEIASMVSMSDIYEIPNKQFDSSGVILADPSTTITINQALLFNLNSNSFSLTRARLKSGILSVLFYLESSTLDYSANATSNNILDSYGNPLSLSFSDTPTPIPNIIDLSGYEILPDNNGNFTIDVTVTLSATAPTSQINYNISLSLTDLDISSFTGRTLPISTSVESSIGFDLPLDHFSIDNLTLYNPHLTIAGYNNICGIAGTINQLLLFNNMGNQSLLITSPLPIDFPLSPYSYVDVVNSNLSSFQFSSNLDSLKYNIDLIVNSQGLNEEITLNENSTLKGKIKIELPANLSINNAVYHDTTDNALYNAFNSSDIPNIEKLTLRLVFTNSFPFDMIPSVDFYDSKTGDKFHLSTSSMHIHGSYNGIPYVQEPVYIELTHDDAVKILNHDKMIINFQINTQGNTVEITDSQFIHVAIGAKINQ